MNNVQIRNNNIHDNASRGIMLEAVFNGAVKDNIVACNARLGGYSAYYNWFWGSQIMIKNSGFFDVSGNEIRLRYGQSWGLLDNQDRGYSPRYGVRRTTNVQIHNNRVTFADVGAPSSDPKNFFHQRSGVESDQNAKNAGMNVVASGANNSVYSNTYRMADTNAMHWRIDANPYAGNALPGGWESGSVFQQTSGLGSICAR